MLKPFSSSKSRQALTAGFGALLVLIITITLLGIWRIYAINQSIESLVREQNLKSEMLTMLLNASQQRQHILYRMLASSEGAEREALFKEYSAVVEPLFATRERLDELDMTSSERAALKQALDAATRFSTTRDSVVAFMMRNDVAQANQLFIREV